MGHVALFHHFECRIASRIVSTRVVSTGDRLWGTHPPLETATTSAGPDETRNATAHHHSSVQASDEIGINTDCLSNSFSIQIEAV